MPSKEDGEEKGTMEGGSRPTLSSISSCCDESLSPEDMNVVREEMLRQDPVGQVVGSQQNQQLQGSRVPSPPIQFMVVPVFSQQERLRLIDVLRENNFTVLTSQPQNAKLTLNELEPSPMQQPYVQQNTTPRQVFRIAPPTRTSMSRSIPAHPRQVSPDGIRQKQIFMTPIPPPSPFGIPQIQKQDSIHSPNILRPAFINNRQVPSPQLHMNVATTRKLPSGFINMKAPLSSKWGQQNSQFMVLRNPPPPPPILQPIELVEQIVDVVSVENNNGSPDLVGPPKSQDTDSPPKLLPARMIRKVRTMPGRPATRLSDRPVPVKNTMVTVVKGGGTGVEEYEKLKCQLCDRYMTTGRPSNLLYHVQRHAPLKQFHCPRCNYTHNESHKVRCHMQRWHSDFSLPNDMASSTMYEQWASFLTTCFPHVEHDLNAVRAGLTRKRLDHRQNSTMVVKKKKEEEKTVKRCRSNSVNMGEVLMGEEKKGGREKPGKFETSSDDGRATTMMPRTGSLNEFFTHEDGNNNNRAVAGGAEVVITKQRRGRPRLEEMLDRKKLNLQKRVGAVFQMQSGKRARNSSGVSGSSRVDSPALFIDEDVYEAEQLDYGIVPLEITVNSDGMGYVDVEEMEPPYEDPDCPTSTARLGLVSTLAGFKTPIGGQTFKPMTFVVKQESLRHSECRECGLVLVDCYMNRLIRHVLSHFDKKRYSCPYCLVQGNDLSRIRDHVLKIHPHTRDNHVIDHLSGDSQMRLDVLARVWSCFPYKRYLVKRFLEPRDVGAFRELLEQPDLEWPVVQQHTKQEPQEEDEQEMNIETDEDSNP